MIKSIAAIALVVVAVLGCFSDRTAGPVVDLEGCNVQLPAEAFGSTIVIIRDFNFSPAAVSVPAGSKVTWVNCEPSGTASHTTTADAAGWTSPLLAPGSTYTRQFDAAGTHPYHCEPHPGMRGSVTVQ
jgi:plastocyanin